MTKDEKLYNFALVQSIEIGRLGSLLECIFDILPKIVILNDGQKHILANLQNQAQSVTINLQAAIESLNED